MTMYGLQLRYPAAAVFPELKQLAAPATLDIPPLDLGVEDHHTAAPPSVRKTDMALGLLEDLLAIELMLARDLLGLRPTKSVLGAGPDAALRMVEEAITAADPHQTRSTGHFGSGSPSGRRVGPQPTGEVRNGKARVPRSAE